MLNRDHWDRASHMVGERVFDKDNQEIGGVDAIAEVRDEMEPEWLVVRTSRFGRPRLTPIGIVREVGGEIHVPFSEQSFWPCSRGT
jgi:hypothetical protein